MAGVFKLEADELAQVVKGLRDVESQLTAKGSTLRGQLGAGGTPWQYPGGPSSSGDQSGECAALGGCHGRRGG